MLRDLFARKPKSPTILITLIGVMSAVVCVATFLIQIPNPATMGYINVGDAMVFTSALLFGPTVGFFCGGIGSALADLIGGYSLFAPITFVVKGVEGALVGLISNGKDWRRDVIAVIIGGVEMISGYFLAETFILGFGALAALTEVPGNFFQILTGCLISVPLSLVVRRYLTTTPLSAEKMEP
ncbi:MAG: ECF transporter S component [Candidatus Bathyarchaeota archaeon]